MDALTLERPISMSKKADTEKDHERVGTFFEEKRAVWLIFGAVPIYVPDVAEIVAKESEGHDAVTNLRIETEFDALDVLIGILTDGLVFTRTVIVEGDVVDLTE
jgi:hypothetical protein